MALEIDEIGVHMAVAKDPAAPPGAPAPAPLPPRRTASQIVAGCVQRVLQTLRLRSQR